MQTILNLLAANALWAAVLAMLVLAATQFITRPAVRHALWLIVLVRLLVPPVWSVPVIAPREETVEWPGIAMAPINIPAPASAPIRHQPIAAVGRTHVTAVVPPASPEVVTVPVDVESVIHVELDDSPALSTWLVPALAAIWAGGALFVLLLAFIRARRFERALRQSLPVPVDLERQVVELAQRIGLSHVPGVLLVPGRVPPLIWQPGLRLSRARLVFPVELYWKLDAGQREALIAHELAHLARRDPWVRWIELAAVAAYWWFPVLAFIRHRLRASEEECCDTWVVARLGERRAYATALLETVEFLDGPDVPAAPALASGASPVHDLHRRLTMIMQGSMRAKLTRWSAGALLGLLGAVLAVGPSFSNAQDEKKDGRPDRPKENFDRPKGEPNPREQPKNGPDRPKNGPDRPKDGADRPKDRPFPPKDGPAGEEFEALRKEMQQAREEAEKAMGRVRELQEKMARLVGERGFRPMGENPPMRDPVAPPMGRFGQGGSDRQIQEMQKQIEDMRRMIEDLRRDLRPTPDRKP